MKKKCPIVKDECWEHGCEFYTHLIGMNPQTAAQEDQWGCSISWLPILLIENASNARKVQASTDKVATEIAKHHYSFLAALQESQKKQLTVNPGGEENGI